MDNKCPREPLRGSRFSCSLSGHNLLSRDLNVLLVSPSDLGLSPLSPIYADQPLSPRPRDTDPVPSRFHICFHTLSHRLWDISMGYNKVQAGRYLGLVLIPQ